MVRSKVNDGIKSDQIVSEVEKRPCLYDTNHRNYGDRTEKMRSWEEVCENVVPGWCTLELTEKFAAAIKELKKRHMRRNIHTAVQEISHKRT